MSRVHVLLGVTGSVACIKLSELVSRLQTECNAVVRVVSTPSALHFIDVEHIRDASDGVFTDTDEWATAYKRDDPILHIELRRWADLLLVAPLTANTLAVIANGLAPNVLTTIARAWSYHDKPLIVAPAMNVEMWNHPATAAHIRTVSEWGAVVVPPMSKRLACGDVGVGAMADLADIVSAVNAARIRAT